MEIISTLQVVDARSLDARPGVTEGQELRRLVGSGDVPTDRIRVEFATYRPGTVEALHWHPIEAFYFVLSGHAVVRDIEDNEVEVGPGSFVFAPAGIAGAHEWEVLEGLELVAFRATNDPTKKFQFTVDKATKRSFIEVDELARREGISFPSHY